MKKSFLLTAILLLSLAGISQNQLIVKKSDQGLYLEHTVVPKENFYSIGRLYNVSPKDIASFNGLDMNGGLQVDQLIRIPLGSNNFSQTSTQGRPVYYEVGPKEGLYRVSVNNNNVLMANLRKWNSLTSDNINAGQKLIIGYLQSSEAEKIVASQPTTTIEETPVIEQTREEVKKEPVLQKETIEPKVEKPVEVKPTPTAVTNGKGGYFRSHFEAQQRTMRAGKEITAATGIFKTAAGWQDEKYYALMDGAEPGTIIRLTNPTNSNVVYAKVLGEMSGIRQNQGYDVRISNAAAAALGLTDTEKFILRVNW